MERGDTGLGRDLYGLPRRRRPGDRRGHGLQDDAEWPGDAGNGAAAADGTAGTGTAGTGATAGTGGTADGTGTSGLHGAQDAEADYYGQLLRRPGEFSPDERLRQPGRGRIRPPGRFPPPAAQQASDVPRYGDPAGDPARHGGASGLFSPGMPVSGDPRHGIPVPGAARYGPVNGGPTARLQDRLPNGRRVPPGADRLYRPPMAGGAGGTRGRPAPGQAPGPRQDPPGGMRSRPARPPQAPAAAPSGTGSSGPAGAHPVGPVIRQREAAVPGERPAGAAQSAASIAPDDLESFARDLRALRAKAELDYPEMAEASHYTMKTLASAAGGLRLPTLPVAVAFVRACGGNVAEWEERWQKLAGKLTADAAGRCRVDGEDRQGTGGPADPLATAETSAPASVPAPEPGPDQGPVYVITSAKPRQPGW